jgi:hypothetical protein
MNSVLGSSPWQTVRTLGGTGVAVGGTEVDVLLCTVAGDGSGVGDGGSDAGFGVPGVSRLQAATRPVANSAATRLMVEASWVRTH